MDVVAEGSNDITAARMNRERKQRTKFIRLEQAARASMIAAPKS
jgi:hypothetical protein